MSKVSIKKADYLLDEKLMTPEFRCGCQVEYVKVLLIQKISEIREKVALIRKIWLIVLGANK